MTKAILGVGGGIVIVIIVAIAALSGIGRDPSQLIEFLSQILVPTMAALVSAYIATQARDYAKKTEHNTNGTIGELVRLLRENGINPAGHDDINDTRGHDGMGEPPP